MIAILLQKVFIMPARIQRNTINFKQLRCFHTVGTIGSFTQAGKALRVGQPSITVHVKALEEYFDVELFSRHGHNVELTKLGEKLLNITKRVFTLETEAIELLTAASGFQIGHLSIGAISPHQITNIVMNFGKKYPDVDLSVSLGNSQEIIDRVLDFRDDVGIVPQIGKDPRFLSIAYSRNRVVLLVPKSHEWEKKKTVKIKELSGMRLVLREQGSATRRVFEDALFDNNVTIRRVMSIGSREAVQEAVANGLGIGIALENESRPDDRVSILHISDVELYLQPHVICLQERSEAPLIKAFLELVKDI
jgi:LysR family transcriptional regulator, low CO2-responsive transcriptional regulator